MTSRVLFLDMDGVLSTPRAWCVQTHLPYPDRWVDPVATCMLNMACARSGAVMVVSSTWRLHYSRDGWLKCMHRWGLTCGLHADWRTPDRARACDVRGREIQRWLDAHPEITEYVILDDDSDMLEHQLTRLVCTDSHDGMMMRHHIKCLELFGCSALPA